MSNKANSDDSHRLALFVMTAFATVSNGLHDSYVEDHHLPIFEKTYNLCFKVIDHFKDSEDICEKCCHVIHCFIFASKSVYSDFESVSKQLTKRFQTLHYSCFIHPFLSFIEHDVCVGGLVSQTLQESEYDDVLIKMDIRRLVELASKSLLSQDEGLFNACHGICKKKPETNSIAVRLYNSSVHRIVKNCIEFILSQREIPYIKGCGDMLQVMNSAEVTGIGKRLKIEKGFINDILESYPEKMSRDKSLDDSIIKILNQEAAANWRF
ncbi:hypothetical protein RF11_11933 [Thelohanellus kitauei]|uniref:Uncharacterized protein n=1 Tax=Thelohanellus kitauei TaxID=669202 RepID=A0A0C2MX08_THEKT|nr:hypothetical protein RF11_11933 [Thelohanellus kitauei]